MKSHPALPRAIDTVLLVAIAVDVVLPVLALARPAWWFEVLHVGAAPDALHVALLHRAAAQWVAFAVVQILALARWRREPGWLLITAGVRASDWLTDLTYFVAAPDLAPVSVVLLVPLALNVGMALFLAYAHPRVRA